MPKTVINPETGPVVLLTGAELSELLETEINPQLNLELYADGRLQMKGSKTVVDVGIGAEEMADLFLGLADEPWPSIVAVLREHAKLAVGDRDLGEVALEWFDDDFDADEIGQWLGVARCYTARAATDLASLDYTPEDAAEMTPCGLCLGEAVASGRIRIAELN